MTEASVAPAAQAAPAEQPMAVLSVGGARVTLLGTAHVSRSSAEAVERLIASGEHDAVAIELDPGRLAAITDERSYAKTDLMQVLREGKAGVLAVNLALGAFQQRLADQFGIEPGAEMRAAVAGARERGLPLLLIDRDIGVTLKRLYGGVGWWRRMTLVAGILASAFTNENVGEEEIEKLKEGDVLEATFAEFAESRADLYGPLIAERDEYMAAKLLLALGGDGAPRHGSVLAVVGAGHLKGITAALVRAGAAVVSTGDEALVDGASDEGEPADTGRAQVTADHDSAAAAPADRAAPTPGPASTREARDALRARLRELETTPPPSKATKLVPWAILVLVVAGFAVGFLRSPEEGLRLLTDWSIVTATMAGLGTLAALAHPLTIAATAVAAPFTTLNPLLGAGFVAAGVELWVRKP
ncbi:MAG TPA: TraB/GumN family protein, partial [Trueperaceae bacterium]|nr:TraB/GumN family protein [Trueperaceae bacterium]